MRTYIVAALFIGLITAAPQQASLKNRLGQTGAKNLAQAQWSGLGSGDIACPEYDENLSVALPDLECPCEFTELPVLGGGLSQAFE